jgi:hypothetical protein
MHPTDYAAMTRASEAVKISPDEFCKLVIHEQSRTILERIKNTTASKGGFFSSIFWR